MHPVSLVTEPPLQRNIAGLDGSNAEASVGGYQRPSCSIGSTVPSTESSWIANKKLGKAEDWGGELASCAGPPGLEDRSYDAKPSALTDKPTQANLQMTYSPSSVSLEVFWKGDDLMDGQKHKRSRISIGGQMIESDRIRRACNREEAIQTGGARLAHIAVDVPNIVLVIPQAVGP